MLTLAQLQSLKADILADPVLSAKPNNDDGNFAIAEAYNLQASPDFTVWRTAVEVKQVMENGFVWTAVDGLAASKARIWEWMSQLGTINPSKANVRQGLADCFGAGTAMAISIAPHLKRLASRVEKLFATGTGSTNSPATMGFEGALSYRDVGEARNL